MSNTQQPRFFIDHDCIHDRLNGTHIHGDRSVEPGIADEAVAMLNTLNRLASFAQTQAGIAQERDALKARVAELEKDSARFRWLLHHLGLGNTLTIGWMPQNCTLIQHVENNIDTAMAASKEAP